jgi:hypothetical protein
LIFRLDAAMRAECERHSLRFCCEDCAFFDPRDDGSCAHGLPVVRYRAQLDRDDGAELYFCKEFNLG